MKLVPFSLKYGFGQFIRRGKYPYDLIELGSTVVQVGAPVDTLHSGRSRAMHFAKRVGSSGALLIVEPDENSDREFSRFSKKYSLPQIKFFKGGAWSEKTTLTFQVDPKHPATNFTEGAREYSEDVMRTFQSITMRADSIDNILESKNLATPKLVSITTNGAEEEILKGLKRSMASGLEYICLARTGDNYVELMAGYGYEFIGHDDRGYTFKREN